jgi:hypothetical protein
MTGPRLTRVVAEARDFHVHVAVDQDPGAGAPLNHATVKLTLAPIVADSGSETTTDAGVVPASYFSGGGVSPVRRK